MKFVLVLTLMMSQEVYKGGMGGSALAMHEFNTRLACENAGEHWKKYGAPSPFRPYSRREFFKATYFCAQKGEQQPTTRNE